MASLPTQQLYFAHPVSDYNTPHEAAIVELLSQTFQVVNPNHADHAAKYAIEGMDYFVNLADTLDACAFLRFPDDTIGAGVAKEVEVFLDKGLPVFDVQRLQGQFVLVPVRSLTGTVLDVEQTRATRKRFSPTTDDPSTHPSIAHWSR